MLWGGTLERWLGFRTRNNQNKENQTLGGGRSFLYSLGINFSNTNFANRLSEVQEPRPMRVLKIPYPADFGGM